MASAAVILPLPIPPSRPHPVDLPIRSTSKGSVSLSEWELNSYSSSQHQVRIAARRRVYDMRYLTRNCSVWPLPPCNPTSVMESLPTKKEKNLSVHRAQAKKKKQPKSTSTYSPFSPPLYIPAFCFTNPSTDHFSEYSLDEGVTHSPN